MTQLSVMDLAKQGDPQAIAALINRSLASKGIHATANLDGDCLKISLQAAQIPNQKAVVTIIQRGMLILQVAQIKRLKILTYRSDNNYLAWQHELNLLEEDPSTDLPAPNSLPQKAISSNSQPPTPDLHHQNMQSHNAQLASNPSGAILAQNLSQLHQNLQEYQDIIVRFTDEHVGTVRCLTTLTELIQVISKPSFLFATVAASPNLRNLLDAIAESSQTDAQGDQVITNLSILQPGHQWQKAKIRLVSKIFLETDQEQNEHRQNDLHQGITLDLANHNPAVIAPTAPPSSHEPPQATSVELTNIEPEKPASSNINDAPVPDPVETPMEPNLDQNLEKVLAESPQMIMEKLQDLLHKQDNQAEPIPNISSNSSPSQSHEFTDSNNDLNGFVAPIESPPADISKPSSSMPATSVIVSSQDRASTITAESLFDDFLSSSSGSSSSSSLPEEEIVSNTSNSSNVGIEDKDDLFDSFSASDQLRDQDDETLLAEQPYPLEIAPIPEFIRQVEEETLISDTEDDLFGEFQQSQAQSPQRATAFVNDALNLQPVLESPEPEVLAASTLEGILSSIDTISISDSSLQVSSPAVTLDDFSDDLESIGF
ncbi:MAG: hypothetical protein NW214_01890 [Pseudanabaenaceae cyanobacterium bins.39]|nr:hypothetical protein [Pseudanabaenaceae cyanobacterium bins.39]